MELQDKVTVPEYPLIGFTLIVACAPVPAGTLLGAVTLLTVIVNWEVTDSTDTSFES
jgi:hypothetical protein